MPSNPRGRESQGKEKTREKRSEIETELTETFKKFPKVKLQVGKPTAEFVTPDVLRSEGTYALSDGPSDGTNKGKYSILSRKHGDHWLIISTQLGSP